MSFVYLVRHGEDGLCKIGHTKDPATRIVALQASAPLAVNWLRLIRCECSQAAKVWERYLKGCFPGLIHHAEWYRFHPELVSAFDCISPAEDVTDEWPTAYRCEADCYPIHMEELDILLTRVRYDREFGRGASRTFLPDTASEMTTIRAGRVDAERLREAKARLSEARSTEVVG